ncbi:RING-type E3 ubiquitin-protein ligase PPIL2 [Centruroides vittatus]|uniref:RING-type E3 ubiquitin-protein ligase PPIL2 n=1 Tax=Centruroides vittatus TaxID=120091 RepID=UPI00350F86FC
MGKRQHQKDKMYLTCTEWTTLYGGHSGTENRSQFRRLPFFHCSLSLQPFEHPFCTNEGVIYDLQNILPFLKKYGLDPATGKKLNSKSLIKLNFSKNFDGKYHCPVLFKVFNQNSHIVAIKTTGNVFSYEAVEQLNLKPKNFKDLLTEEPFTRADIITIQDPNNLEKFDLSKFHHLKHNLKVVKEEEEKAKKDPTYRLNNMNTVTREILEEFNREYKPAEKQEVSKTKANKYNAAHYSTGAVAASFTSTAMEPVTELEAAVLDVDVVRYSRIKKKGYLQLQTNFGPLNIQLHCDMVPKTCENFMKLCQKGYYDNTVFHRSIKNFMIQGGDPTGSGAGGESYWGKKFKDEFKPNLVHQGRGVVSMANTGPNTNKSQFFITYRSCRHLDNKHSVFGQVVGGLDTLTKLESISTDEKDKPVEEIKIIRTTVFVDPYEEVDKQLEEEKREEEKTREKEKEESTKELQDKPLIAYRQGIGKYLSKATIGPIIPSEKTIEPPQKKKKEISGGFGDFSSW